MADRRYESLVLIHPDQGEAGMKETAARIRTLVEGQGGTVTQIQEWGQRDLSYLIGKQRRAYYVLLEYRVAPAGLQEVERNLKLMDAVLRFVSVRQDENAPPTPPRSEVRHFEQDDGDLDTDLEGMVDEGLER